MGNSQLRTCEYECDMDGWTKKYTNLWMQIHSVKDTLERTRNEFGREDTNIRPNKDKQNLFTQARTRSIQTNNDSTADSWQYL